MSTEQEPMICGVCRRVLSRMIEGGVVTYIHSHDTNHDPDPMPQREMLTVDLVCDFCSAPTPEAQLWTVLTTNFIERIGNLDYEAGEDWAACPFCADLIRTGQWDSLSEHALRTLLVKHPALDRRDMKLQLEAMHGHVKRGFQRLDPPVRS